MNRIRARGIRCRLCQSLLAGITCGARDFRTFPYRLSRQDSPVHFFWGSFDLAVTPFPDARRRAIRAASRTCPTPSHQRPIRTRYRAPDSGRAGAGRSTTRRSIPTRIRPPTARGGDREAGRGIFQQGPGRVFFAVRRGAPRSRSRCRADGIPAKHLQRGSEPGKMGSKIIGVQVGGSGQTAESLVQKLNGFPLAEPAL